ncbi:hypothetical protein EC973_006397 [Apophysomyces ossiformis]|uniref:Uncharacterized protein n=1 Tax=Apophysomyces ossiformis TaxID=679940 RepID=A0A8H7BZ79_9FUNG|nr:hypothetical protein EC973_006397 [Apophysomyces ossiformis]
MALFNQVARRYTPPTFSIYLVWLSSMWMVEGVLIYVLWIMLDSQILFLVFPLLMIFSLSVLLWRYRLLRYKFEQNILEICAQLNATQNVLGINFRFIKNVKWSDIKPVYAIVIEFDDRFQALTTNQFNGHTTIPLPAYCLKTVTEKHPDNNDLLNEKCAYPAYYPIV